MVLTFIDKILYELKFFAPGWLNLHFLSGIQWILWCKVKGRKWASNNCSVCLLCIGTNKWRSAAISVWVFGQHVSPYKGRSAVIYLCNIWSRTKKGRQMSQALAQILILFHTIDTCILILIKVWGRLGWHFIQLINVHPPKLFPCRPKLLLGIS